MSGPRPLKIFFDGGCQPNPGPIEVALVAGGVTHFIDDLGSGSSNDAEWLALREALKLAHHLEAESFELVGDSAHVIAQAQGRLKCRTPAEIAHRAAFADLLSIKAPRRIRWVKRAQNLAGIALDRRRLR